MQGAVKQTIHQIVGTLSEDEAANLLDYLNLLADPDTLTEAELRRVAEGRAEIARSEYVTLDQIRRRRSAG